MDKEIMDRVLLENFPVVTALHAHPVVEPENYGTRYVIGKFGLYREVSTPWLYALTPVAQTKRMPTPYGDVHPRVSLKCGSPDVDLWADFIRHARQTPRTECAALMAWNVKTSTWRLAIRETVLATHDRVDYAEAELEADEVAVVDVHSHGQYGAVFSPRDDADDAGSIKVAAVIGRVEQIRPEIAVRLMCLDVNMSMHMAGSGDLALGGEWQ